MSYSFLISNENSSIKQISVIVNNCQHKKGVLFYNKWLEKIKEDNQHTLDTPAYRWKKWGLGRRHLSNLLNVCKVTLTLNRKWTISLKINIIQYNGSVYTTFMFLVHLTYYIIIWVQQSSFCSTVLYVLYMKMLKFDNYYKK